MVYPASKGAPGGDGWTDGSSIPMPPRPGATSTFPLLPTHKKQLDTVKVQFPREEKGCMTKMKMSFQNRWEQIKSPR